MKPIRKNHKLAACALGSIAPGRGGGGGGEGGGEAHLVKAKSWLLSKAGKVVLQALYSYAHLYNNLKPATTLQRLQVCCMSGKILLAKPCCTVLQHAQHQLSTSMGEDKFVSGSVWSAANSQHADHTLCVTAQL